MITRAKVIKKLDSSGYKWAVNIPILNGIPDSKEEYEIYQKFLNSALKENLSYPEENQKSKHQIVAEVINSDWGNGQKSYKYSTSGQGDLYIGSLNVDNTSNTSYFNNDLPEFTMEAYVCGIGGIQNLIHVGDTVYVGFEDNDMGKPIILGHLLTESLESIRSEHPSFTLNSLQVKDGLEIPHGTSIKGSSISISDLLIMYSWYNALISTFPGGSLIKLLQDFSSVLSNFPNIGTNLNSNDGEEENV